MRPLVSWRYFERSFGKVVGGLSAAVRDIREEKHSIFLGGYSWSLGCDGGRLRGD